MKILLCFYVLYVQSELYSSLTILISALFLNRIFRVHTLMNSLSFYVSVKSNECHQQTIFKQALWYIFSATSFPNVFSVNFLSFRSIRLSTLAWVNFHCTISPRSLLMMCSMKPKEHLIVPLHLVTNSLKVLCLLAYLSCHIRIGVESMIEIPVQLSRQQLLRYIAVRYTFKQYKKDSRSSLE